ncbi:hypothetical protein HH303_18495 [Rhodospirillaceae bacterium KN72]|uniref:Uncharacterized protein n=1 Tax=Pacificispira spongiicola TaxID=2729598 RepID=A0A7Y0E3C1_9PROT|nr:hypothetical protein [Pacificispira spongiicola]NMM46487.1 hypothetical protein [Pacificispira spongiicola]
MGALPVTPSDNSVRPHATAWDWLNSGALTEAPPDIFAFALMAADTLAPLALDYYADLSSNLAATKRECALATAEAMRAWPDRNLPDTRPGETRGLSSVAGLTTVEDLRAPGSILHRATPEMPVYILMPEWDEESRNWLSAFEAAAVHFWAFHAERQGIDPLKCRSAATMVQALMRYGHKSAVPPAILTATEAVFGKGGAA